MRKQFAFSLAFLIGVNLLIKPFWIFGIDRVVQNKLGAAEYGNYFALMNYSLLFSVLLDLGLNNFNNRSLSRSPSRLSSYFGNLFGIKIILSAVYFLVALLFAVSSGFHPEQIKLLLWLLLNQTLLTLILFFRSNLQALQLFRTDAIISVSDRLIAIILCSSLLNFSISEFSIRHFVVAQTAALALTALISGSIVGLRAGWKFQWWKRSFTFRILKSTFPYALLVLLMSVYGRIDAVLLERLLPQTGAAQAGVYAASYRIFDAANQFGFLFSAILLPLFARNFRARKSNGQLFDFGVKSILIFAAAVAGFCFVFADKLLMLLYHNNDPQWQLIFRMVMLGFVPASVTYIAGTLLTAKGELMALCKISFAGMMFNLIANFLLIPLHGALGCAITALSTSLLMVVLHFIVIKGKNAVEPSFKLLKQSVGFVAVFFAMSYGGSLMLANPVFQFALVCASLLAAMFVFRLFSMRDVMRFIKLKQRD